MNALKLVVLIVAGLVVGQTTGWLVADHVALALLVLLLTAWIWSRLSLRRLSLVRRTASDRAQVGQTVQETVEIRNGGRLGKLWLEVIDHSTLPNHAVGRVLHIRGRGREQWTVETRCVRRGRYRVGPLTLRSGDPLGIFPTRLVVPQAHEVIVYPPVFPLRDFSLPTGSVSGGSTRERRSPIVTPSVAGIRDYAPSDPFGRISWSATARLGRLMVKEFDVDPTADVWLVLDLHRVVHQAATRPLHLEPDARGEWPLVAWLDSTEEYAVAIVASLAGHFLSQGRNVGLVASGAHLEIIAADRSDRQHVKLLEALAVVRADGELSLAEVLVAEGRRFTRQSTLVVVTPSTAENWVATLSEIAGRGVRTAAVIVEPETFGPARSALLAVSALAAAGVTTHLVKYGDDVGGALATPAGTGAARGIRG